MANQIRITVEHLFDKQVINSSVILDQAVKQAKSISDLGFNHEQQINILKDCQEVLLKIQSTLLKEDITQCSKCGGTLKFAGSTQSNFHSVFTDHKIAVKRQKCCNKKCGWTSVPSISSLFSTNSHPDLSKLQTEMACNHTYREAERIMDAHSYYPRKINNHDRIHKVVAIVGNYISDHQNTEIPANITPSKELICQVDGGHLKAKEEGKRSFEALTSVIYSPKNIIYPDKNTDSDESKETKNLDEKMPSRGTITSKHCAASALDDDLTTIKRQTLVAALKQGMTAETKLTALCDGAANCWNVVESLEDKCQEITKILDWFHIAKRFQNISLPKYLTEKLDKVKWCIWHNKSKDGIDRLNEIIDKTRSAKMQARLIDLQGYLENNKNHLVHYADRYKEKKVISSSLAESNVENLINKRCKGKQHMKWSREGVHPLLQVRASCASNDWNAFGAEYVIKSMEQMAA